ncbi:hypothetical protein CE665_25575 [Salmonella enterica subsp. enterica serovar Poona]|nr:hypothetical protein [Salmonella enterica]EBU1139967.1 hypothetical protein [Salmonella enterica]EDJ2557675.1 hypothetical protein [Salmonella enterica subsp. enterica serovar Poona]EEF7941997.1 hypothetical protein [Salmonella enterica subsp. diarizonae]
MSEKMNRVTFRVTDLNIGHVITDEHTAEFGLRLGCVIGGEITDEYEQGRPCLFVVKLFDFNYDFADRELEVYCRLWRCRSVVSAGDVLDAVPGGQITLPGGRVAYGVRDGDLRYNDDAIIQSWH